MKILAKILGIIFSYIIPITTLTLVSGFFRYFYTAFLSRSFNKIGDGTLIKFPSHFKGNKFIQIGNNVSIGKRCCITVWEQKKYKPEILIGNNVNIGDDSHITCINKIQIDENVLFGKKVTITDNSHGICNCLSELLISPVKRELYSKGAVIIKKNVWIGDKVTILPGVIIEEGVIVGANSIVTSNIPAFSLVGGIPAKIIRTLKA